jgi:hypothetical protein
MNPNYNGPLGSFGTCTSPSGEVEFIALLGPFFFKNIIRMRIMQMKCFKVIQVKVWQATVTFSLSDFNSILNEL